MNDFVELSDGVLTLCLALPDAGMPEILYFGAAAAGVGWVAARASRINGMDEAGHAAPLLPTGGMGSFGWPAIAGHRNGRDCVMQFTHWRAEPAPNACVLRASDAVIGLDLAIRLELHAGVLTSAVELTNRGDAYALDRCMAGSMPFTPRTSTLTTLGGSWGREFQRHDETLTARLWLCENRRGRTSHDRAPSLILAAPGATLAAHLGWSGNYQIAIDTLDDGRRIVHLGELFEPGEMRLAPGECYRSPVAYWALDAAALRETLRARLPWASTPPKPRPVTLNTWEGNYFDHQMPALLAQADAAAALGIERFVLDDGWFGRRDDDTTSLGDWIVDPRKYPQGLKPLADHVHARGMEFGLWFEPEMISPDSDLYRAHPEWALHMPGRAKPLSRNQLVLDLSRPDVSDLIFSRMDAVLREAGVDCIKWDMNRDLAPPTNADGRAVTSAQTRAVYALMDRLRAAHPHLEIESCSSGGGRADYGVLAHTHRIWTSDCTDARERLDIQRGARLFFPPEIMGAHVSASPNHQTHRRHSLDFRCLVAFAYHLGVELDPRGLDDAERATLAAWIALHKRLRPVLHGGGDFLLDPVDGRYVWGAADGERLVVLVAQATQMLAEQPPPLCLPASHVAAGDWRVTACMPRAPDFVRMDDGLRRLLDGAGTVSAGTLRHAGLPLPMLRPDAGVLLEFSRVAET